MLLMVLSSSGLVGANQVGNVERWRVWAKALRSFLLETKGIHFYLMSPLDSPFPAGMHVEAFFLFAKEKQRGEMTVVNSIHVSTTLSNWKSSLEWEVTLPRGIVQLSDKKLQNNLLWIAFMFIWFNFKNNSRVKRPLHYQPTLKGYLPYRRKVTCPRKVEARTMTRQLFILLGHSLTYCHPRANGNPYLNRSG